MNNDVLLELKLLVNSWNKELVELSTNPVLTSDPDVAQAIRMCQDDLLDLLSRYEE